MNVRPCSRPSVRRVRRAAVRSRLFSFSCSSWKETRSRRRGTRKFEERISRRRSKTAGFIRGGTAVAAGWLRRSASCSCSCSRLACLSCHSLQSLFLTQLIIRLDEAARQGEDGAAGGRTGRRTRPPLPVRQRPRRLGWPTSHGTLQGDPVPPRGFLNGLVAFRN